MSKESTSKNLNDLIHLNSYLIFIQKPNKEYVYHYRDGRLPYKGNWRNTAGWTSVEIAGKIIERIGPILATKYVEFY